MAQGPPSDHKDDVPAQMEYSSAWGGASNDALVASEATNKFQWQGVSFNSKRNSDKGRFPQNRLDPVGRAQAEKGRTPVSPAMKRACLKFSVKRS